MLTILGLENVRCFRYTMAIIKADMPLEDVGMLNVEFSGRGLEVGERV